MKKKAKNAVNRQHLGTRLKTPWLRWHTDVSTAKYSTACMTTHTHTHNNRSKEKTGCLQK